MMGFSRSELVPVAEVVRAETSTMAGGVSRALLHISITQAVTRAGAPTAGPGRDLRASDVLRSAGLGCSRFKGGKGYRSEWLKRGSCSWMCWSQDGELAQKTTSCRQTARRHIHSHTSWSQCSTSQTLSVGLRRRHNPQSATRSGTISATTPTAL